MQRVVSSLSMILVFAFLFSTALQQPVSAKAKKKAKKPHPSFAQVKDDASLPRVLLIGDSISMGYTIPTRKLLKGKANLHRIAINGGPTIRGVEKLDSWLGEKKWDVIHFNFGLHDIKAMKDKVHQVPIEDYEKNLEQIVTRLKKSGAKLIWCSTTPVPKGAGRRKKGDEVKYNAVALKIMKKHNVAINDLHAFCMPQLSKIQRPRNVHFHNKGSAVLAKEVTRHIKKMLETSASN